MVDVTVTVFGSVVVAVKVPWVLVVVLVEFVDATNPVTVVEVVVLVVGVVTVTITWFTCWPTGVDVTGNPNTCNIS